MLFDIGVLVTVLLTFLVGALIGLARYLVTIFALWVAIRLSGPVGGFAAELLAPDIFAGPGWPQIAMRCITGLVIFSCVMIAGLWIVRRLMRQGTLKWINRLAGAVALAALALLSWAIVLWGLLLLPDKTLAKLGRIDAELNDSIYARLIDSKNPLYDSEQSEIVTGLMKLLGEEGRPSQGGLSGDEGDTFRLLESIEEIYRIRGREGSGQADFSETLKLFEELLDEVSERQEKEGTKVTPGEQPSG